MIEIKPNQDLIERLETMLEQAKRAEILSMAYIVGLPGGLTGSGWINGPYSVISSLGELRILERDMIDCLVDTRIDIQTGNYR